MESLYKDEKDKVDFRYGKSGLAGTVVKLDAFKPEGIFKFPLNEGHMPNVDNKEYFQATYEFPKSRKINDFEWSYTSYTCIINRG